MKNDKLLGSILLLAGTAIGAGMLALPLVSASSGFLQSLLMIIVLWGITFLTALLILEINLAFKPFHNNFGTMAYETLGRPGQIIAWLTCLLLLYSLTAAYISGNGSLLTTLMRHLFHIHIKAWLTTLLFTLCLGTAVFSSTHAVDLLNRLFISIKGFFLFLALVFLMPHINVTQLIKIHGPVRYLLAAAPIMLTSFGFHTVIPSLTNYIGIQPKKLKTVILIGSLLPLIIYILWLITTLGIIPAAGKTSFETILHSKSAVSTLLLTLNHLAQDRWVTFSVNVFSNIAMTTSFLGVSLSLFDFLADGFSRSNKPSGRFQTALLTFCPPLIFAIFYPRGFIVALGYASIFVAILEIILPAFMAYKLRKHKTLHSPYRLFGGNGLLILLGMCGAALILIQLMSAFHLLPAFA